MPALIKNIKVAYIFLILLLFAPLFAQAEDLVSAREFRLIGPDGKMTAQIATSGEGTPSMFFYDKEGRVRLNLGIYSSGAPGVILLDTKGQAAELVRLTDDGKSPVLVFKSDGSDKMILGLNNIPTSGESSDANKMALLMSFIFGIFGGMIGAGFSFRYLLRKNCSFTSSPHV